MSNGASTLNGSSAYCPPGIRHLESSLGAVSKSLAVPRTNIGTNNSTDWHPPSPYIPMYISYVGRDFENQRILSVFTCSSPHNKLTSCGDIDPWGMLKIHQRRGLGKHNGRRWGSYPDTIVGRVGMGDLRARSKNLLSACLSTGDRACSMSTKSHHSNHQRASPSYRSCQLWWVEKRRPRNITSCSHQRRLLSPNHVYHKEPF